MSDALTRILEIKWSCRSPRRPNDGKRLVRQWQSSSGSDLGDRNRITFVDWAHLFILGLEVGSRVLAYVRTFLSVFGRAFYLSGPLLCQLNSARVSCSDLSPSHAKFRFACS